VVVAAERTLPAAPGCAVVAELIEAGSRVKADMYYPSP